MKKKITLNIILIFFSSFFLIGCLDNNNYNEVDDLILKSWKTEVINDSETLLKLEFFKKIDEGYIHLYSPTDNLINSEILNNTKDVSFIISASKFITPYVGNYSISITDYNNKTILTEYLFIKDSKVIIKNCSPKWAYNEILNFFILESINLTFFNEGDISSMIWEGKFIIDNSSNLGSPDYHWHDLDIWVYPNQEIYISLPVMISGLNHGTHFISILFRDNNLNKVSYYEKLIETPIW